MPDQNLSTADQRIRMLIGDLIMQIEVANDRLQSMTNELAAVTKERDDLKAAAEKKD